MPSFQMNRRRWLRGAGVTLALPLLARDADAQDKPAGESNPIRDVKRMVCVANPFGFVAETFFPEHPGKLSDLPPLLQPMDQHREQMTVLSNLDHGVSGGHQAVHSFLSGIRNSQSSSFANRNVTVDQVAADRCVGQVRIPSIVAGVGHTDSELECQTSWTRTGVNIPPISRANDLFELLFATETQQQRDERRRVLRENASVLDVIFRQADALKNDLGASDRRKLDEYLQSVRNIEKNIANLDQWIDRPKPTVEMTSPPAGGSFAQRLPTFYDIIALALQTDSTRVATLSIPGNLPVADLGLQGNYHAFSHHGKTDRMLKPLFKIEHYQIEQFARFIAKLKSIETPDGRPLLDSTMVLCGSGMGNASSHSNKNLPILLAGGGFKHGNHIVAPEASSKRIPLCNLYTTMLQEFGCEDVDAFNTASGTMSELQA
ncbi:hypothetical protein Poly51_50610 [Rubripirellula tenax]|uniref:Secreted protein containing DUF1552 n=1 Tax=Rubripirellula tenax TaxID=2528015 RepID=A0A5C6EE05_9BACT|nr:DUF1552 domain-containing protein [Rubripirellula tenax]TWU47262.1 hypothetical protein Poly51_50610 [Rubripirellula tenax]